MSDVNGLFTEAPTEYSAFDKEEWAKKKEAEKKAAFAMAEETALSMDTPEKLETFLDVVSRFGVYSVNNLLLITAQKPNATKLADSKAWDEKNIYIKKGEKAIMLIEPGKEYTKSDGSSATSFVVKKVFDITQTTSKISPPEEKTPDARQLIKDLVKSCNISLYRDENIPAGENARYDAKRKFINVSPGIPGEAVFAAAARELAFAKLDPSGEHREENILKAYCVSYILCKRAGIQPPLLKGNGNPFAGKDSKAIKAELSNIRSLTNDISAVLFPEHKAKVRDNDAR